MAPPVPPIFLGRQVYGYRVAPATPYAPEITPFHRDPLIPYTLSPLSKGGKEWVRGVPSQHDSVFYE